jgi:hypothetical protein
MSQTIHAKLVYYRHDGEFIGAPITLDGGIVNDEEHGWVLEIVLPVSSELPVSNEARCEGAILVSVSELQKLK